MSKRTKQSGFFNVHAIQGILFFLILMMSSVSIAVANDIELENKFVNPPDSAKPWTFWFWMNGNVTKQGITADLEAMKRIGLGGFELFNIARDDFTIPAGPASHYMGNTWWAMVKHAIQEADRLGLKALMQNCAGWSNSGGPWIPPEYSMKKIVWTEKNIEGPNEFSAKLQQPEAREGYYRDIAVLAFPTPQSEQKGQAFRIRHWQTKGGHSFHFKQTLERDERQVPAGEMIPKDKIVVLSDNMDSSGKLKWQVPAGTWTIIRFGYTSTGETNRPSPESGKGLECDKLSKTAAERHWKNAVQPLIDEAGPLAGRTLIGMLIDSYEVGHQNWTQLFAEEFRRRMGYDLLLYMPALTGRVVESMEISERFLWDFRLVIADLFTENYYGHFAEMCHRNGMVFCAESYGVWGNFNDFTAISKADIPMGEWWIRVPGQPWHLPFCKLASSAAHTQGRKTVAAEAFTSAATSGFISHPFSLKASGDYFFCQGLNRIVFHLYVHQPWQNVSPGMTLGPIGLHFNRNNTWFEKGKDWVEYITRCQSLLQQGKSVADLCYFAGEDCPAKVQDSGKILPTAPFGYDYDFCIADILFQMTVNDGIITLPSGAQYRMLVLPDSPLRPEVLRKVRNLVKAGAQVYGPLHTESPSLTGYPACDDEVNQLADEILGSGNAYCDKPLDQVLSETGILPDFEFVDEMNTPDLYTGGSGVEYVHRRIEDADVYFISNQHQKSKLIHATFRIHGKQPELWNPETGLIKDLPCYSFTGDRRTVVPLALDPSGSVFVVFRKPADKKQIKSVSFIEPCNNIKVPSLEIKRATSQEGTGKYYQRVDVTETIKNLVRDNQLTIEVDKITGATPRQGLFKTLSVDYALDGEFMSTVVPTGHKMVLPEPAPPKEICFEVDYQNDDIVLIASRPGRYEIQKADGSEKTINVDLSEPVPLAGPWTLHFPAGWGAPEKLELEKLIDWTAHEHYDVRHFSGTAVYAKKFTLPENRFAEDESVYLDLGAICIIAEVKLNGKKLGILWKPPFKVDVSDVIRPGSNLLEVEVTNLWANRLIGDEKYRVDWTLTESEERRGRGVLEFPQWLERGEKMPENGRKTFVTWLHYKENDPLFPSGLLGPVRLISYKKVIIE